MSSAESESTSCLITEFWTSDTGSSILRTLTRDDFKSKSSLNSKVKFENKNVCTNIHKNLVFSNIQWVKNKYFNYKKDNSEKDFKHFNFKSIITNEFRKNQYSI